MNENVVCLKHFSFFFFLRPCPSSYTPVLKFNVKFDSRQQRQQSLGNVRIFKFDS